MRAPLTLDRALEVRSLYAQSRDTLRALVSAVGWYCVVDAPDGTRLYAQAPGAVALPLDVAVAVIVAESRQLLAREEGGEGHEQAGEQSSEAHAATVASLCELVDVLARRFA